jgi:hypothetical protein
MAFMQRALETFKENQQMRQTTGCSDVLTRPYTNCTAHPHTAETKHFGMYETEADIQGRTSEE